MNVVKGHVSRQLFTSNGVHQKLVHLATTHRIDERRNKVEPPVAKLVAINPHRSFCGQAKAVSHLKYEAAGRDQPF